MTAKERLEARRFRKQIAFLFGLVILIVGFMTIAAYNVAFPASNVSALWLTPVNPKYTSTTANSTSTAVDPTSTKEQIINTSTSIPNTSTPVPDTATPVPDTRTPEPTSTIAITATRLSTLPILQTKTSVPTITSTKKVEKDPSQTPTRYVVKKTGTAVPTLTLTCTPSATSYVCDECSIFEQMLLLWKQQINYMATQSAAQSTIAAEMTK